MVSVLKGPEGNDPLRIQSIQLYGGASIGETAAGHVPVATQQVREAAVS